VTALQQLYPEISGKLRQYTREELEERLSLSRLRSDDRIAARILCALIEAELCSRAMPAEEL